MTTGTGTSLLEDRIPVAAPAIFNCYWYVHIAELILDGKTPRKASELAWRAYYTLLPASELVQYPGGEGPGYDLADLNLTADVARAASWELLSGAGGPATAGIVKSLHAQVPDDGPHKHWTTRCLTLALQTHEKALALAWDEYARRYAACPRSWITSSGLSALRWQTHMMWLLATGAGDLLHCARIAYDRAAGRPARKRKPADPSWLAAELDAALSAAWEALALTDDGAGHLVWTRLPSEVRPRADDGSAARW